MRLSAHICHPVPLAWVGRFGNAPGLRGSHPSKKWRRHLCGRGQRIGNQRHLRNWDNTFTIPKSRVQSIENGARPAQNVPNLANLPSLTPDSHLGGEEQLLDKIVRGHEVDRDALAAVESRGNANEIALAYYIAGRAEFQTGKYNDA